MKIQNKIQWGMPTLIELKTAEESVALAKELGLSFVELNMNLPNFTVEQLENTEYLKKLSEKYGITYTIHLDENLNICDFNRSVSQAYLDTVIRVIHVAKILNVPIINMHMNHGVYFTLPDHKVWLFREYQEQYMEDWKHFRKQCEEAIGNENIRIAIENTDGFTDFEKNAIRYLLESSVFSLTWDIGHSHAVENIDESFIREHAEKLKHVHIHDGRGSKNHLTLGTGEINLEEHIELAKKLQCRCVLETKTVQALKESVIWLRKEINQVTI